MTVWCRRFSIRIRLVLCLILPAEAFPRTPEQAGSTVYKSILSGSPSCRASHQAHAFNSAGFSWQLLQALQCLRLRRVGHRETEVHVMVPGSAAPCHVDFLLVPHNNLAEVRLPSDVVPSTASITETVVYTVLTFDVLVHACNRRAAVSGSSL